MRQTLALFLDAYRELNSKKLFWITMGLSGLVVMVFAAFGINEKGLTFLHWQFDTPLTSNIVPAKTFYRFTFAYFGVPIWLTWVATILALISTASIFPDFLAGGSIELALSKPISRIRLFVTKFATGLLFAGLQVFVFTLACFLVIGLRGSAWDFQLFLAVPVVVIFFSYLYSMCVLFGLLTKSTIASLLLTLLVWVGFWTINTGDALLVRQREATAVNVERNARLLLRREKAAEAQVKAMKEAGTPIPTQNPTGGTYKDELEAVSAFVGSARREGEELADSLKFWTNLARLGHVAKTVLPKTSDTIGLLDRWLLTDSDRELLLANDRHKREVDDETKAKTFGRPDPELEKRVDALSREDSTAWIIGTSLGFEAFILAICAWIFARRDF